MRRIRSRSVTAGALVILTGCAGAERADVPAFSWSGSVIATGGMTEVRNDASPILPDSAVGLHVQWTLEASPTRGGSIGEAPIRITAAFRRIYVLDQASARVTAISRSGTVIGSFARAGRGPGELARPVGLMAVSGGIGVQDDGQSAVVLFTPDGAVRGSVHIPAFSAQVVPLSGVQFAVETFGANGAAWVVADSTGSDRPFFHISSSHQTAAGDACSHAGRAQGYLALVSCTSPTISLLDTLGGLRSEIALGYHPHEPTEAELDVFKEYVRGKVGRVGLSPGKAQAVVDAAVAANHFVKDVHAVAYDSTTGLFALWQQEPSEFGGGDAIVHIVTKQGFYLAKIPLHAALVDFAMDDGVVYGIITSDTTGTAAVRAYRLVIPPAVKPFIDSLSTHYHLRSSE